MSARQPRINFERLIWTGGCLLLALLPHLKSLPLWINVTIALAAGMRLILAHNFDPDHWQTELVPLDLQTVQRSEPTTRPLWQRIRCCAFFASQPGKSRPQYVPSPFFAQSSHSSG